MRNEVRDAILSCWKSENQILRFNQIKQHLEEKGVISRRNYSSVSRWLKELVEECALEKLRGYQGYRLIVKPAEFQVFNYLQELRNKYSPWEGEVGGSISHLCAITLFGLRLFPREKDELIAFNLLLTRIGEIFGALENLRNVIIKRRAGLPVPTEDLVNREVFFAMLKKNIDEEGTTEELVERYKDNLERCYNIGYKTHLDSPYAKISREYFASMEKPLSEDLDYSTALEHLLVDTWYLKEILANIEAHKSSLKEDLLDVDKHNLDGLFKRYRLACERMFKTAVPTKSLGEGIKGGRVFTLEESQLESQLRDAILVKVAERIKEMGIDFDDFALVLTRHPATMNRYYTAEHVLYNAMKWAAEEPEDWLKRAWLREWKKEKNFEGVVTQYLVNTAHFSSDEYKNLRYKPWVLKELSKYGSFDKIIKLYSNKMRKKMRKRREFLKQVERETRGKEPIDINRAIEDFENAETL